MKSQVLHCTSGASIIGLALCLTVPALRVAAAQDASKAAPKQQSELPAGYVGSKACIACHEASARQFKQTKMGKMFAASKTISPRLEYRFEQYDRVDWQTQFMRPYMAGRDSDSDKQLFLGADLPSYRANVLAATLEFRF